MVKVEFEIYECIDCDEEWGRFILFEIVLYFKNIRYVIVIEFDYVMEEGVLILEVWVVMVGYLFRCWNVDCIKYVSLCIGEY